MHPLFSYSFHGEWNSEAGRGVQCVDSKFRMYFLAWEERKHSRDGGGMEN